MGSHEAQQSGHNHRPSKVQKAEEDPQSFGQHRTAIYGIAAVAGAVIRGGIVANHTVNIVRQKLEQYVYLAAIASAMAGWMWMIFEGLQWVLGA